MNGHEKSDSPVVPTKRPNKAQAEAGAAEAVEGRELAKGNPQERDMRRTQRRHTSMPNALERIREAARRKGAQRFTALMHHVYDVERLRSSYSALRKQSAAGVDGVTWRLYGQDLESNLQALSARLKQGTYRAQAARRAFIPKADGTVRPLGIPTLEDKLVQRSMAEVLEAVYEVDFLGFSYGFRRERSPHHALDALAVAIERKKVNWVLDADIRGFFDTLDHGWLQQFVEHRVGDRRVVHLILQWLKAGVLDDGKRIRGTMGTVQGGSISPLLANTYLHYVFDLWAHQWRRRHARGDVVIVRFADDFVVGFENRADGERFLNELRERFAKFNLALHPEKTRLIEFGRHAAKSRHGRGLGKPETFDFLGFTHISGKSRNGKFLLLRRTARKRFQAKLKEVRTKLRSCLNWSTPQMGSYLAAVVRGHVNYYGVPHNSRSITVFRLEVGKIWRWMLERRSQRTRIPWERMRRLVTRWLPLARVCHPYPNVRFDVIHPRQEPDAVVPHVRI